jgi:RsiW-degrading membrane proteinase PrsW (M82 family)
MLSSHIIYLIFPTIGAILGAMLWLSYLKKIDVFEHERIGDICIALIVGYLTPSITLWVYYGFEVLGFNFNGNTLNDILYAIFGVGVTEEFSKLLGVVIVFNILKKRISEPIDYLIFAGVVALGFSVRENFIYYNNYGSQVLTGRTLISCLTHIINTSICVYGLYSYNIFKVGTKYGNAFLGLGVAVVSHGLFDLFLAHQFIGIFTPLLASIIYLIGINFWIQFFNNAINFSPFFNYQKIAHSTRLYKPILFWYAALVILEFIYAWYYKDILFALKDVFFNTINEGVLLLIVALRINRLKINKRKYFPIKIQFPVYYTLNDDEDYNFFGIFPLKIRGENEYEFRFIQYMGKVVLICPLDKKTSVLKTDRKARLLKKYFLKNDVVTYLVEIQNDEHTAKEIFLLKPKTTPSHLIDADFPIATLMHYDNSAAFHKEHKMLSYSSLKPIEEVYIKA